MPPPTMITANLLPMVLVSYLLLCFSINVNAWSIRSIRSSTSQRITTTRSMSRDNFVPWSPDAPHDYGYDYGYGYDHNNYSHFDLKTRLEDRLYHDGDSNRMTNLARLAVALAFSQTKTKMKLHDINIAHVNIVSVDWNHIELEAVVCEDDGCLTVFVPLFYPNLCHHNEVEEECILSNLDVLNEISAAEMLKNRKATPMRTREYNADAVVPYPRIEDIDAKHVIIDVEHSSKTKPQQKQLIHTDTDWWVKPKPGYYDESLRMECITLQKILNEERFQDGVVALANSGMDYLSGGDRSRYEILNAIVVDIGPAGIIMRAEAMDTWNSNDKRAGGMIIEIPYKFSKQIRDANELRATVLGAILYG